MRKINFTHSQHKKKKEVIFLPRGKWGKKPNDSGIIVKKRKP